MTHEEHVWHEIERRTDPEGHEAIFYDCAVEATCPSWRVDIPATAEWMTFQTAPHHGGDPELFDVSLNGIANKHKDFFDGLREEAKQKMHGPPTAVYEGPRRSN